MRHLGALAAAVALLASAPLLAVQSVVEQVVDGVFVVRDDAGQWGGDLSKSITHQSSAPYEARKTLDMSALAPGDWDQVREVRLSVHLMVRDYSWHDRPPANGLDEAVQFVVNGHVHEVPTARMTPVYTEGTPPKPGWFDLPIPREELVRGANEVILRKAPSDKNDDYLYLSIDHTQRRGNSAVAFDSKAWTQDALTIPGGNGEYMVRLYLVTRPMAVTAAWRPGQAAPLDDPGGLVLYAGAIGVEAQPDGLRLGAGQYAQVEWEPDVLDRLAPASVQVQAEGAYSLSWLDDKGSPADAIACTGPGELSAPADRTQRYSGVRIAAAGEPITVTEVELAAARSIRPVPKRIDMCPAISPPRGRPGHRDPTCTVSKASVRLANSGLRCRFDVGDRLTLGSLYNEHTAFEMLRDPAQASLFLVEVDGKRYAGSRDFRCVHVEPQGRDGFAAALELDEPRLTAQLTGRIDDEGLRLGLVLTNAGEKPVDFRLAFPCVAGLAASERLADDYYFFPWGGGLIADTPAVVRRGYGDHEALFQVMDLFSPARGGGLYVRADDAEGWHKGLALRKHVPGQPEENHEAANVPTGPEYKWTCPLEPAEGFGLAYEYVRRTREPGGRFEPAQAVFASHPGDWHTAMAAYAAWAHRVWQFRPFPSRLAPINNMIAAGWAGDFLFRDGKYRTDFIQPNTDCIELMSWWDWSPLGPWRTPFDQLSKVLSPEAIKGWEPYFVKDPVTGQTMWNNQPGDYDGYNERFGGLPAFRAATETYRKMGALVTLYTDPIRLDDGSKMGQQHGKEWTVIAPNGDEVRNYDVWTPCHDVPEYRKWVADTMERVMRETGADGIRLDEYGHAGWACFSTTHTHTFQEHGVSQWQKEIADTTRQVREAMDRVDKTTVLTTEHPAYDYLWQYIDGCLTYDLTVQSCPLRPVAVNLQRFYFPECKVFELDHQGVDPQDRRKFFSGTGSFGRYYPPPMHAALRDNESVYQTGEAEALVPTLVRYLYANRFAGGGKTIVHLFNGSGHTVSGRLIELSVGPGQHVFDLLRGREVALAGTGNARVAMGDLARDDVACLIVLPRRLEVTRSGDNVTARVAGGRQGMRIAVCDADGRELASSPPGEPVKFNVPATSADGAPWCVKLLRGRELVDAAEWP